MDSRSWTVDDDARVKMAAAVIWWLLSLDECGERAAVEGRAANEARPLIHAASIVEPHS
jgi:hypothetical protein